MLAYLPLPDDELLRFAQSGGTLVITGLSGLYDEHGRCGALRIAFRIIAATAGDWGAAQRSASAGHGNCRTDAGGPLPSRLWMSSVIPQDATALRRKTAKQSLRNGTWQAVARNLDSLAGRPGCVDGRLAPLASTCELRSRLRMHRFRSRSTMKIACLLV